MRILITGSTGFAGSHLAEALLTAGRIANPSYEEVERSKALLTGGRIVNPSQEEIELFGTSLQKTWPVECKHLQGRVHLRTCDLCNKGAVAALVREVQPQRVYHLAGYAHAGQSFREPQEAWAGNLTATCRLYDAIARWGGETRILFVGSGLVYGDRRAGEPAPDESAPLRPSSPYASSKAAADLVSYQYTQAPGLDIVRVRPFNHIGPRQSPQYAVAHFAKQIADIERGQQPPVLKTGDLRPERDLTDVRDIVRAYVLLMQKGQIGEVYNAGTGNAHAMEDVVKRLLGLARVAIQVEQRVEPARAADNLLVRADASRLRREIGWQPRIPLEQTLADTLNYWRQQP